VIKVEVPGTQRHQFTPADPSEYGDDYQRPITPADQLGEFQHLSNRSAGVDLIYAMMSWPLAEPRQAGPREPPWSVQQCSRAGGVNADALPQIASCAALRLGKASADGRPSLHDAILATRQDERLNALPSALGGRPTTKAASPRTPVWAISGPLSTVKADHLRSLTRMIRRLKSRL
jgi:hypothetical protein